MVSTEKVLSLPIKNQQIPFFPSYINYILQNASPKQLLKLYQCCKYFYSKLRITNAPNVWYMNNPVTKKIQFTFYTNNGKKLLYRSYSNIEKLWLTGKLYITTPTGPSYNYGLIGSEFLNKIYRNNLKKLSISSGYTLIKELGILSNSQSLTKVELFTSVKNEFDEPVPIEEIMVLFPFVEYFGISPPYFTLESFHKLLKFKFLNKIKKLKFWLIQTEFDPKSLCDFLKNNFDDDAYFSLTFYPGFYPGQIKSRLLPQVQEIIKTWKTKKPKYFYGH